MYDVNGWPSTRTSTRRPVSLRTSWIWFAAAWVVVPWAEATTGTAHTNIKDERQRDEMRSMVRSAGKEWKTRADRPMAGKLRFFAESRELPCGKGDTAIAFAVFPDEPELT